MIPTVLTVLLTAACVLADTSSDPAAARRAFSVDVSFKPMPRESDDNDSFQQSQQPAPVTSIGAGEPWAWKPSAPELLEPKGPPPFMPDDRDSVEVPAEAPILTTITTTAAPAKGLFQAAMPLMSGVQNMVGQAEAGAKQLLHLPANGEDASSGKAAAPESSAESAMKAETTKAEWRLKIAHKQAAELQAKLAKVNAQLKRNQEPVAQNPMQAPPQTTEAEANSMERLSPPAQAQATPEASPCATITMPPVPTTPPATAATYVASQKRQKQRQHATATPKATTAPATPETTRAPATPAPTTKAKSTSKPASTTSKQGSSEPVTATHKTSTGDEANSRLSDLAAALRGSPKLTSPAHSKRLYTATPAIFSPMSSSYGSLSSQGNMLVLGSAAVAIAAVMALATRFARAHGQGPAVLEDTMEGEDSAIE